MQALGKAGLHALALARGEDQYCGRATFAHAQRSPRVSRRNFPGPSSPGTPLSGATPDVLTRSSSAGYRPVAQIGDPTRASAADGRSPASPHGLASLLTL